MESGNQLLPHPSGTGRTSLGPALVPLPQLSTMRPVSKLSPEPSPRPHNPGWVGILTCSPASAVLLSPVVFTGAKEWPTTQHCLVRPLLVGGGGS